MELTGCTGREGREVGEDREESRALIDQIWLNRVKKRKKVRYGLTG